MIEARFHDSITDIPSAKWDALRPDDNPFLSHTFLAGLEHTGCIRPEWGWQAHHFGLYRKGELIAAAPLYLKGNSHGEFVFDWNWAGTWERAGGDYYPKLLNAVPYSPVTGPRLLVGRDPAQAPALRGLLVQAMQQQAECLQLSSVHSNFLQDTDLEAFNDDWMARNDVQFHWHNRGYADFDAFLAVLNHKKRKNIRHERQRVTCHGLQIGMHGGAELDARTWQRIHTLYTSTFDAKGNHAALTEPFFQYLRKELGNTVQLALARQGEEILAAALMLRSATTLYGRYWGACVDLPDLHFELCYYQGIEYAIAQGLERFEPGAQGEHKLARGFLPVRTHSRHYLLHEGFRDVIDRALAQEREGVEAYVRELLDHSPYAKS
ncbi:N-acetyltransferase [Dyella sp. M7H15-1]|uniref:GNAT family N-acetyltransferase n=1 Tax=Dyella sp. M7H15-1 TaxID=2501295 RepID=UPI001004D79D|nr:GNAT family N-acetyltransferase [Dyella sp. M7H15-1]QAU25085.1 N-acetyltransferase [Dyella sp. M7H15-1]